MPMSSRFNLTTVFLLLGFLLAIKILIFVIRLLSLKPDGISFGDWCKKVWWSFPMGLAAGTYLVYFTKRFFN